MIPGVNISQDSSTSKIKRKSMITRIEFRRHCKNWHHKCRCKRNGFFFRNEDLKIWWEIKRKNRCQWKQGSDNFGIHFWIVLFWISTIQFNWYSWINLNSKIITNQRNQFSFLSAVPLQVFIQTFKPYNFPNLGLVCFFILIFEQVIIMHKFYTIWKLPMLLLKPLIFYFENLRELQVKVILRRSNESQLNHLSTKSVKCFFFVFLCILVFFVQWIARVLVNKLRGKNSSPWLESKNFHFSTQ